MLRQFDFFETERPTYLYESRAETSYDYYLGEICSKLGLEDENDVELALSRVFDAFRTLELSIPENFKKIYFEEEESIFFDWKLSKLALYLFVINANTSNPNVARMQVHFFRTNRNADDADYYDLL